MTEASTELTVRASRISEEHATRIAQDVWGLDGTVEWLWGEKDSNYRLSLPDGREYLLKILTPGENPDVTRMHSLALLHVANADPSVPVQRVISTTDGAPDARITDTDGFERAIRLVSFVTGEVEKGQPQSPALRRSVGDRLARLQQALADFEHPAAHTRLTWDMAHFAALRPQIALCDTDLQPWMHAVMDTFQTRIEPMVPTLPAQVIHNDFNPDNLLVDPAEPDVIAGVIDFGDMVHSTRIFDIGVAIAYQLQPDDPVQSACDVLAGFAAAGGRLTPDEQSLLWTTVKCRNAMRVIIPMWQGSLFPERRDYFHRNGAVARANIRAIADLDDAQVTDALIAALTL